jgi:hypothetical protein
MPSQEVFDSFMTNSRQPEASKKSPMTTKRRLNPDRTNEALGWELFEVYETQAKDKESRKTHYFRASVATFVIGAGVGALLFLAGLWAMGVMLSRWK